MKRRINLGTGEVTGPRLEPTQVQKDAQSRLIRVLVERAVREVILAEQVTQKVTQNKDAPEGAS